MDPVLPMIGLKLGIWMSQGSTAFVVSLPDWVAVMSDHSLILPVPLLRRLPLQVTLTST